MMKTDEEFGMVNGAGIRETVNEAAGLCDVVVSNWEVRDHGNDIQFELNTTDNVDILDILSNVGATVRGQRFTIERFIGQNVTSIIIENPVITMDALGQCMKAADIPLMHGVNEFTEINTHELCSATPLAETCAIVHSAFGAMANTNVPIVNVISEQ